MFCVASEAMGKLQYTAAAIRQVLMNVIGVEDDELLLRPFCQGVPLGKI